MKALGDDRLAAVERTPQRIDDAAEESGTDRGARDLARSKDALAGLDDAARIEQDDADAIGFERERKAELAMLEAQQLVELDLRQSGDEGDAVGEALDAPHGFDSWAELGFA